MTKGIDPSGFTPAERIVATSGAVLFLDGFIPWWYRVRTPHRTYLHNAGLTGWGLLAVLMGFVATVAVVAHSMDRVRGSDDSMYIALAVIALAALGVQARAAELQWIGFWLATAASVLMFAGGLRRRREKRGGWI